MYPSDLLLRICTFLLPPAIIGTAYIYLYPAFQQCHFPEAKHAEAACYFGDKVKHAIPGEQAPFRLLAFADPQLEGDTSIPGANDAEWWKPWEFPKIVQKYHKKLDLWGNDLYLAHVYRTMRWFTNPTHVVVLGDLLGSQWIPDKEFDRRSNRFWNTVFSGGEKVPLDAMQTSHSRAGVLGKDKKWENRIIAVPGNHDIGYSGDIDEHRIGRFERRFGKVNWQTTFALNETTKQMGGRLGGSNTLEKSSPELRLVILNSMNLDEPFKIEHLHRDSRAFVSEKLYRDLPPEDTATVILTHLPLHKQAGVCTDPPFFDYFDRKHGGGIKEQNHLSYELSEVILSGVVGPELYRRGIILNGHDHTGCEVYHWKEMDVEPDVLGEDEPVIEERWEAKPYHDAATQVRNSSLVGLREVTVRSMMGQYWGNAGMLSAWWDRETKEWKFDYESCALGIQHIWWGVHALDLVVISSGILGVLAAYIEVRTEEAESKRKSERIKKTS